MKNATVCISLIAGLALNFVSLLFAQEGGTPSVEEASSPQESSPSENGTQQGASESMPLIEIKKLESEKPLFSIELRNVPLTDLFRVIAHDYDLNILVDKNVSGTVTASLTNISLEEALEQIAAMQDLILEKKGNVIIVKPHFVTRVFILKHVEANSLLENTTTSSESAGTETASTSSESGTTNISFGGTGSTSTSSQSSGSDTESSSRQARIYDLLSPEGKVLLGKQPNSIMVIDYPENVERIGEYIEMVDKGMTSRVFRLKYISAQDLVGEEKSESSESSSSSETESTSSEETGSSSGTSTTSVSTSSSGG